MLAKIREGNVDTLSDGELACFFLGSTGGELHERICASLDLTDLEGLAQRSFGALSADSTEPRAALFLAAVELGKRVVAAKPKTRIQTSADVAVWGLGKFGRLVHEEMWILALDGGNRIIGASKVSQGGLHESPLRSALTLRAVLLHGVSSFAMVHNHPGGDTRPSAGDITATRVMVKASKAAEICLVDHVIISPGSNHFSFLDAGLLGSIGEEV